MPTVRSSNESLGLTAYWTASARALENSRPDGLLKDPWAADLAGEVGQAWLAQRSAESVLPIVLRTRYFDDFLQRITAKEGIRQVVLLGAGLDTRAYRLHWPEQTQLYELDQSAVLDYKEMFFQTSGDQPRCSRKIVRADITLPWSGALRESGYDAHERSIWLVEGLLFYLPSEQIVQILDEITTLTTAGSWLGFDIINRVMLTSPITQQWLEMQAKAGAPWIGTMDDPVGFLLARGWQAALTQAGAEDANYGRWTLPIFPVTLPNVPHNWYVTAVKQHA